MGTSGSIAGVVPQEGPDGGDVGKTAAGGRPPPEADADRDRPSVQEAKGVLIRPVVADVNHGLSGGLPPPALEEQDAAPLVPIDVREDFQNLFSPAETEKGPVPGQRHLRRSPGRGGRRPEEAPEMDAGRYALVLDQQAADAFRRFFDFPERLPFKALFEPAASGWIQLPFLQRISSP